MAHQLTGEEFEIVRDLFNTMDIDGDARITADEFKEHIKKGCKSEKDKEGIDDYVDFLMRLYDIDGNGSLEFPEFLQIDAYITYEKKASEEYVKQLFKALDKEEKGYVSADDVKRFCRIFNSVDDVPYNEEKLDALIKTMDINGDGKIDYQEFVTNYFEFKKFDDDDVDAGLV